MTDLLFRHFRRIALAACLPVAACLMYNAATGPSYTAMVRVLVTPGATADDATGETAGPAAGLGGGHGQTARNQAALLNDRGLMAKFLPPVGPDALPQAAGPLRRAAVAARTRLRAVAVRLGLADAASPAELLADRMGQSLEARALGDTDVVSLRFTWPDRVFAARTLNHVLASYQRAIDAAAQARGGLAQARTALRQARAELAATGSADAAAAETAADVSRDKSAIEMRLAAARAHADELRLQHELAARKLADIEHEYSTGGWVDDTAGAGGTPGSAVNLAADFAALLKQRQDLSASPNASARALRRLDSEISDVREQNYVTVRRRAHAQVDDLSDQLVAAAGNIGRDEAAMHRIDTRQAEAALQAATRQARLARVDAASRAVAEAGARIDPVWQEVGSTRALSDAAPPALPDWPSPAARLNAAALLGVVLGLAAAVLAERSRRTIDLPRDIARHLHLEVLARLPDLHAAPTT